MINQNQDPFLEDKYRLELIPLARAMVGMDVSIARKINPIWCLRPEAAAAYNTLSKTPDELILSQFLDFKNRDAYMEAATRCIGDSVFSQDIATKMREWWTQRKEQELIAGYLSATTAKQKNAFLNALKALNRPEVSSVYVVDMANPSPPEVFLLEWQGVGFLPRGDISSIKAKAKSGKTQFVKQLVAALISPTKECNGLTRVEDEPLNVLWMDTEQSYSSSDKAYRQMLRLAGLDISVNSPHVKMINTRMKEAPDRLEILDDEVSTGKYDVVILDGLRDVFRDINDPLETTAIFTTILRLIQETRVSFVQVIHENPNSTDSKMRGWMGTEAENKSFEVFQVKFDDSSEVFTVKTPDRREQMLAPFGFKFEANQLVGCEPEGAWSQGQGQNPKPSKDERDWEIFTKAFAKNPHVALTKQEIVNEHLRMSTLKKATTLNRIQQYILQKKLIANGDPDARGTRFGLHPDEVQKLINRYTNANDDTPF